MSNEGPQIAQPDKTRSRFGEGLDRIRAIFRVAQKPKDIKKKVPRRILITLIILAIILVPTFFILSVMEVFNGLENKDPVSHPDVSSDKTKVDIPIFSYHSDDTQKTTEKNAVRTTRQKKFPTYEAAEIVSRPINIKDVPVGYMAKAVLSSGASDGIVRATLQQDVNADGEVIIESGSVLLGRGVSKTGRVHVTFTTVTTKDGKSHPISAQALDPNDKAEGIKASVITREAKKLGSVIGLGMAGRFAKGLKKDGRDIISQQPQISSRVLRPDGSYLENYETDQNLKWFPRYQE